MSLRHEFNAQPKTFDGKQDHRTKQSFKEDCDINNLLKRAQREGSLSHLAKYEGEYGDFANVDLHQAMNQITRGRQIFSELPSEMRREFNQDPVEFFKFVNNPDNVDKLTDLFPALAKPGTYQLDVRGNTPPGATLEPAPAPEPEPTPDTPPETPPE